MKSKISKDVKTSISHHYYDCVPSNFDGDTDLAELDLTEFSVIITKGMVIKCTGRIGIDFRPRFTEPWNVPDPFIMWFDCSDCKQDFIITDGDFSTVKSVYFDSVDMKIEVEF